MPRVKDGKSIARATFCATLEYPKSTKGIYLAFIIAILAFANCINLGLGSYANDVNGDVPPLNSQQSLRADNNHNKSNSDTILKEFQLSETKTRQVFSWKPQYK